MLTQNAMITLYGRKLQSNTSPENTQIALADTLNVFDTASLAPGATVIGKYSWFDGRNVRANVHFMNMDCSPMSSVFGFHVGGHKRNTVSVATSFYF